MMIALWVSMDIFASGGNALGKFYFYILIASFLYGLFSPKKAFFYLLFQTAYLDYFKRLMILDSGVRMFDLYWVLGISPATFAGIALGLIFQLGKSDKLRAGEGKIIVISVLVTMGLFGLAIAGTGMRGKGLGNVLNSVMYIPCLFVIPRLFSSPEELARMLRFICYLYIPSAAYLIYQSYFGLTWWEHKYLQSGLSIEVRQYNEKVFRCMGTMAGASGATIIYSLIAALLAHGGLWRWSSANRPSTNSSPVLRFCLAIFFAFGAWRTFSRTGWVLGLAALAAMIALDKRSLVIMLYASAAVLMISLFAATPYLLKHKVLNDIDQGNRQEMSAEGQQSSQLSTLNGRLEGYDDLMSNPRLWTPFGKRFSGNKSAFLQVRSHDFVTDIIVNYGFVPLLVGLFLVGKVLITLHTRVFNMRESLNKTITITGISVVLGIALGGITSGAIFSVFPQNLFVYMFFGSAIAMILIEVEAEHAAAKESKERFASERESELATRRGGRRGDNSPLRRRQPLATT
jgi:hypothetical protein